MQVPHGQYQQPYGYPQGGFGGPPPKKSKAGMAAGISAAVVVVVVFLVTAFAAPGFLLGDDDDKGGQGDKGGTAAGGGEGGGGAEALAQQIVDAFNDKDSEALKELTCADADGDTTAVIRLVDKIENIELVKVEEVSDTKATAEATITYNGMKASGTAELANEGDAWCWQGFKVGSGGSGSPGGSDGSDSAPGSSSGDGSDADAEKLATDFIDAVNGGDADTAMSYVCEDAKERAASTISQAAGGSAELTLDELNGTSGSYNGHVSGTVSGQSIEANMLIKDQGDGLCVAAVFIS